MKDEIKEILEYLKDKNDYIEDFGVSSKRIHIDNGDLKLLDYITNLQQEIKETNKLLSIANDGVVSYSNVCIDLQQRIAGLEAENQTLRSDFKNQVEYTNKIAEENERLKDIVVEKDNQLGELSSRIYKTIEYIESQCREEDGFLVGYGDDLEPQTLLNILQNGSEEK